MTASLLKSIESANSEVHTFEIEAVLCEVRPTILSAMLANFLTGTSGPTVVRTL